MEKKGKLELTWVGKYEEEKLEPRILIEDKSKSYGDPDTENMLIHGDNLLALKALERDYAGKIKCVYIDPPYNTGNAFEHYDDDVEHSLWLNMIYKRVQILHKLLSKDGTLWMSIDSTEGHYLKVMCDEIFGRSNFVSDITYEKSNVTGLGQGGAIFNTGEKLLVYKKETVELNEVLATEKLTKKTMQRYRKYIKSEGRRELVDEFESASNGLPVKIYKHTGYEIGDISLKNFEARESEIRAQYYQFFDTIYRTYVVQQENEFQNALMSRMEKNSLYSVEYVPSRGRNEGKQTTLFYHNGELCAWLKDTAFLEKKDVVKTTKLSNVWKNDDIPKADLGNEGGVAFPRSKKPEKLIERILLMATNEGDLVLDSFLGSGTTAAVAHKMRRRYIGIELGDHCYTHCKKRLDRVIDGKDRGGVTNTYDWQGGGGYKFYELAEPLLVKNKVLPVYQINPSYTWDMVCEAICKIEGFTYTVYKSYVIQYALHAIIEKAYRDRKPELIPQNLFRLIPDYQGMYRLFKCHEMQPQNHLYDKNNSCEPFIINNKAEYILVGSFEIRKQIDYHQVSWVYAYQGIVGEDDEENQIPFQQCLVSSIENGECCVISSNLGALIEFRRTLDLELEDEGYLWPGMTVSKLLNVHIEFDFLNGRYIAVNQDNDIVFIMKKWSSSYKGDSEYPGNAIPLYSGTELYIKKEYIEMLEKQFGTLMMKTYVKSYTQTY